MNWCKMSRKFKSNLSPILIILIIIELSLIIYFGTPMILDTPVAFVNIKSDSMEPVIHVGDWIIIKGTQKNESLVGEILLFIDPTQSKLIVHRAIAQNNNCYITKGDNSQQMDFFQPCDKHILGIKV